MFLGPDATQNGLTTRRQPMHTIIYLTGLIVVILAVLTLIA
jgi:hypothetical protein